MSSSPSPNPPPDLAGLTLDSFPLGVSVIDGQGRILQTNAAASRLLGLSTSEHESLTVRSPEWKIFHSDGSPVRVEDLPAYRAFHEQIRIEEPEMGVLRPDGEIVWLSITAAPLGLDRVVLTYGDITEIHRSKAILAARSRLSEHARGVSLEHLLRATLDETEALTGSCIGFYHFMDTDQEAIQLKGWSTRTEAEFCRAEGKDSHYAISKAGVWADCVRERRPLIHNDYANLPNRKGMPPGHATVLRELVVPVFRDGLVVAILGVGNKPTNYNEADVETVQIFADLAWDLVEQKRTDEALINSEARWHSLVEQAGDGFELLDQEGRYLQVNEASCQSLGYSRAELLGMTVFEVDPGLTPELFLPRVMAMLDQPAVTFETVHKRKDGTEFPAELTASVIRLGGDIRVLAQVRDINERKQAESRLLEEKQRFQGLVDSVDGIVWEADARTFAFTYVSAKAERLLGYPVGDWKGQGFWAEHIHPEDRDYAVQFCVACTGRLEAHDFEYRFQAKDGSYIWLRDMVAVAPDAALQPRWLRGVMVDITERKLAEDEKNKLQAQLHHAQKMDSLGTLASGVAHDMNNVLGAILGLASAHIGSQPYGSPLHQALDTICKATERGGKMVKSLLSFARQSPSENKNLDMNAILKEQVSLLERTTMAMVRLEMDLEPELRSVRGDASVLAHAFMNLCVNAVDAMPESGTLTLRTRNADNDWIEVVVEDSGIGMSKEVLKRAMEPFFTTKETGKGTGLGLSIVFSAVNAHRGQIDIHSEPGKGTRVRLRFPAWEEETQIAPPADVEASKNTLRSLTVLLVDDDELIQSSVQAILEVLGYSAVTTAQSGEEALAKVEAGFDPDLVILDMNMPGMGGAGTLPRLRGLRPDVPVLLSTGRTDQTALTLASAHPGVTLLAKPFGLRELQKHLESLGLG